MKADFRRAAFAVLPFALAGCSWLTDFRQQPSIGPWQSFDVNWMDTTTPFRGNPQGSVPITGTAFAAWQVSYGPFPGVLDSMAGLPNPVPVTQASVDRGWRYYQINCAVCHGDSGAATDGTLYPYAPVALSLLTPTALGHSDGYLWAIMRNGRGLMPSFNRIDERERWHVVNYVRGLQGRLSADIVVPRGPVARPGVTGVALPGATYVSPQRGAPFAPPTYVPSPGTGAASGSGGHE